MTEDYGEDHDERAAIELVACPECGNVATIEWESGIAGVLYVKVHCIDRHWFLMLAERITCYGSDSPYRGARHVNGIGSGPR